LRRSDSRVISIALHLSRRRKEREERDEGVAICFIRVSSVPAGFRLPTELMSAIRAMHLMMNESFIGAIERE
jgi:hypothetical protein